MIFELLKDSKDFLGRGLPTHDQAFQAHSFRKTDRGTIELIAPVAEFHVPNEWKTVASLDTAPIKLSFNSGHERLESWRDKGHCIGNRVDRRVYESLYDCRSSASDREAPRPRKRRTFFASHAEKQLIVYFISKHVLIESEGEELLQRAQPPILLKQATILVSRPPCDGCLQFIGAINTTLCLMILVLDRSER